MVADVAEVILTVVIQEEVLLTVVVQEVDFPMIVEVQEIPVGDLLPWTLRKGVK